MNHSHFFLAALTLSCCVAHAQQPGQPVFRDTVFQQKFSVKYTVSTGQGRLIKVAADRNGTVQVLSSSGLLKPVNGALLYPGQLVPERSYRFMADRKISGLAVSQHQLVYLDSAAVLSNAWAGKLYYSHHLPAARLFCGDDAGRYLVSDGRSVVLLNSNGVIWHGEVSSTLIDMMYDEKRKGCWLLAGNAVLYLDENNNQLHTMYSGNGVTCFSLSPDNKSLLVGTHSGYMQIDANAGTQQGELHTRLPATDLTVIRLIGGHVWFGSTKGAFMLRNDGRFDYYASQRWIPSDNVTDIAEGSAGDVLLLTDKGLADIHVRPTTLEEKAAFFEQQVRERHIRNGFNATVSRMTNGDPATGSLEDSDNDGLWTSMYLGAEAFRYAVTHSPDALQNCRESLDAIERLYTINPITGFPARSFERRGYEQADTLVWRKATDPQWDWKSTTSSDEAIGHIFAFGVVAELIDDSSVRNKAINLIDALMQHIVDHRMYLVDWDGKPTRWARWNPEYVNARPVMVGDRKITSSNITAMLQTAWHFTHKTVYRDKAMELLTKYGYLDNLMRPMSAIGPAPPTADELSRDLSGNWNHSDDEMYFLGYWGLYRYAFNDTLKAKFRQAILDHWQAERPEKEAAWNITTALTGVPQFDLDASIWYLQRYPLDLVNWDVVNSGRKDLDFIPENFRRQTITEVLPPDELPIHRHNANLFDLDDGNGGRSENSAGDIWLLPYWMGRYLGVISAPQKSSSH